MTETSAAIEEMTASLDNMLRISESNKASIDELVKATTSGEKEMISAEESIRSISEKAGNIFDITGVIRSIASRTNLLAINAAIEANNINSIGQVSNKQMQDMDEAIKNIREIR